MRKHDAETQGPEPACPFCGHKCDLSDGDSVTREGDEGDCPECRAWWSVDEVVVKAKWWRPEAES